jgi:hypothetical protein
VRLHVATGNSTGYIKIDAGTSEFGSTGLQFKSFNNTYSASVDQYQNTLSFSVGGNEAARIDSSRRLLVGTSSTRTWGGVTGQFQLEGTSFSASSPFFVNNSNDQHGPFLLLGKSRGTSIGSNTIVQSGDMIGSINFAGADGSVLRTGANIEAFIDGTPGSGDLPTRLVFSTTADGASSPTERMRITNDGNVIINTTTAGGKFSVFQGASAGSPAIYALRNDIGGTTNIGEFYDGSAGGTLRFGFRCNGGLANYSANDVNLSDRNVKKDISLAAGTWDCLKKWKIVNFRYTEQPDDADLNLGVIAQQVAESCPEVITVFQEAKEATETEPAQEERLGVKEQQMMWMAIKALQEAQVRIETLEAEVAALKGA